jgi:hypothetical protein
LWGQGGGGGGSTGMVREQSVREQSVEGMGTMAGGSADCQFWQGNLGTQVRRGLLAQGWWSWGKGWWW